MEDLEFPSFWQLVTGMLVGAVFISFSIPNALIQFGKNLGWSWLSETGSTADSILSGIAGSTASTRYLSFNHLWSLLLIGLLTYVGALALLAIRYQQLDLFIAGVVSLAVGTAILNLIAWVVYLFILLLILIAIIVTWIFSILGIILKAIFAFLAYIWGFVASFFVFLWGLLVAFWAFLISSPWWILAAVLVLALLIYLAVRHREALITLIQYVIGTAIVIGGIFLIRWLIIVLAPLWAFLASVFAAIFQFLALIVRFIVFILGYVVVGLVVGFVVYGIGAWVMDLFRGAWKSGNGRRGVVIGSLAIGSALAFILLETNLYHTDDFPYYPLQALTMVHYFHQVSPIFDILVAVLVVAVSILGILRNLGKMQEEPSWSEFQSAMVMAALGVIIVVGLYIIGSAAGGQSSSG